MFINNNNFLFYISIFTHILHINTCYLNGYVPIFIKINNERKREQASISHSPINYKLDTARHNE